VPLLHYAADATELAAGLTVTRADGGHERTVPRVLGADPAGLPYEVLAVDYDAEAHRSTVHLGPASPDTLRGYRSAGYHRHDATEATVRELARVRHYWRPDLWPAPVTPAGASQAASARQGAAA
jgi:hypothetical protein